MKLISIILFCFTGLATFSVSAEIVHHLIQEPTDSGKIKYTVIEENTELRDDQNRLSQSVIYRKISAPEDHTIMSEALKQRSSLKILERAGKPLWVATKTTWSVQDEKDYQVWFEANAGGEFNKGTALLADCADVGLLFRWAYAHDKKLPVANSLSGSGKLFGHFSSSSSWDKLPSDPSWKKDERFKQAMRYLFENTYTHSIFNDLYPTQINPTYVHPGSMYMIIRQSSGHTQTIYKIDAANAGIRTLWGNEPSAEDIYESYFIWEPAVKNLFGLWRWPVYQNGAWKLTSAKNMPGYSDEQFVKRKDLGEDLFQVWTWSALGLVDYDEIKLGREIEATREALEYRLYTTVQGALICGFKPCDINGSDYNDYSTNSRDARLLQFQATLLKSISGYGGLNAPVVQSALSKATSIGTVVLGGFPYTYKDFILDETLLKNIKADANLTLNQRWGLNTFPDKISQFKLYQYLLSFDIYWRQDMIATAYYYCIATACDANDPQIIAMNTVKMDRGFVYLADLLFSLKQDPEVAQGTLLEDTYNNYRQVSVSNSSEIIVASALCENPAQCSMYDVFWKDDGLSRVKAWKSQPTDLTLSRWGL
jgi:hypothetical protein